MPRLMLLPCVAMLTVAAAPATLRPPAVATEADASDPQQAATHSGGPKAAAQAERKICKQLDSTGSRLPRRACLTAQEWKQIDEELQQ
jgi:hypothetical protein